MTLNPEVFRKAAVRIDKGFHRGACVAIGSMFQNTLAYEIFFEFLFMPKETKRGYWLDDKSLDDKQQKNRRVIALLFAAEVLESGGI
jgi:hypothetical protein